MTGRVAALEQLHANLSMIREEFSAAEAAGTIPTPLHHRRGAGAALLSFIEFIDEIGWKGQNLEKPIFKLLKALASLDEGVVEPILVKPTAGRGRPPLGTFVLSFRARIVAIHQMMVDSGKPEPEAATFIFRRLDGEAFRRLGMKNDKLVASASSGTISEWRDDLDRSHHDARPAQAEARETYEKLMEGFAKARNGSTESVEAFASRAITAVMRSAKLHQDEHPD